MLGREEDLELVVGEATNSREAVELCRRLRPDLVLISRATAKVHVERIIKKLGDSDRTQAAVRALQLGLVET